MKTVILFEERITVMIKALLVASVLQLTLAASVNAQEIGIEPIYGRVSLTAGGDHAVELKAGGLENIDVTEMLPDCRGFVSRGPHFVVDYTAGEAPLVFLVHSKADTTLLVNFPNGSWACDDDSGLNGGDPGLVIFAAPSGQYDIWVGAKEEWATPDATLRITDSAVD
ncbi:peptidase S1 [Brevundimonas fluminis]|jgi:hypothetical protein|uniref:peptidase S1 n=1 Tax=Brevundimonas fluminis TaxID=2487274 RepID=UPI000F658D09|nr:peptidase S1 [Brevundimonas fluminis]